MSAFLTSILTLFLGTRDAVAPKADRAARHDRAVAAAMEQFELSDDDFDTARQVTATRSLSRPASGY